MEADDTISLEARIAANAVVTDALAVPKNIATNARLFSVMIFVACIAAFVGGYGPFFARLAVLSAVPVGLSVIIDQLPESGLRLGASFATYAFSALVALSFLLTIG